MSASDAAPLPRLGEVFFDVRGNSRSMRLSWYADTGIAVFSIWQGGRCTGTFRLPMDDLARMTDILQRGPQRQRADARHDQERGDYEAAGYDSPGHDGAGYDGAQYDGAGYDGAQYDGAGYEGTQYDGSHYEQAGYDRGGQYDGSGYDGDWYDHDRSSGHGADENEFRSAYPDRTRANRPSAGRDSADYERSAGYADSADYERSARYADSPAEAGASDATGRYEFPARPARPEDGGYLGTAADHEGGSVTDLTGYGQQRFVPPYVQSGGEAYPNDNPAVGSRRRHTTADQAYPGDRAGISAEPDRYPQPMQSPAGYSGGSEYQPAADPGDAAQHSAGRHSGRRTRSAPASSFDEPDAGSPGEPISERDYWRRQAADGR